MRRIRLLAAAVFLAAVCSAPAHAGLIFEFSFDNTVGTTPGTVTGRIFGLEDNRDGQAATSIVIDTFPDTLEGSFLTDNDAAGWDSVAWNSFDVSNGAITAAIFSAQTVSSSTANKLCLRTSNKCVAGRDGGNFLTLDNGRTYVSNNGGFSGVRFAAVAIPLPPALALFAFGLGALGLAPRGRSKRRR